MSESTTTPEVIETTESTQSFVENATHTVRDALVTAADATMVPVKATTKFVKNAMTRHAALRKGKKALRDDIRKRGAFLMMQEDYANQLNEANRAAEKAAKERQKVINELVSTCSSVEELDALLAELGVVVQETKKED